MRTTLNLIFVAVCVTFYSCQKDDLSKVSSSITNDGVISGKIVNYVPNSIDSVITSYTPVTSSKVSSSGEFSIRLNVPQLSKEGTLSGVTVSDTTAMGGSTNIYSCLNSTLNGDLLKSNFDPNESIKAGMAYSEFFYTDRSFTMKGTNVYLYTTSNQTMSYTTAYDVTFKRGWNEVVCKIISYSTTMVSETKSETYTNNITPDLQWHFFKSESASFIRGKLHVIPLVNSKKIFSFK
jgi:hypothetical protein